MTDRWRQIEELYNQACECAESDRAAFLENACAGDAELRQEVESLLAQGGDDPSFMGPSAMENAARDLARDGQGLAQAERLGDYTIVSLLGKGGMGEVYRARDAKLGRDVALKVLPSSFALDPERIARFDREARLLASLNHPNIATIHSIEESRGRKFLVLELIEGETLSDRLKRGRISVSESLQIALQIAEGLEAAHEKGVIHRDLKPANIQFTKEGRIKLLDFGLAKFFAEDSNGEALNSPTVTARGRPVILGTAAYMSPEQAAGGTVDRRTDVWAFGCVLYEMLTGVSPFLAESFTETLDRVIEAHVDINALPAQTPTPIVRLVQRCLERNPRERLQHIGDARVEIRDILSESVAHSTKMPAVAVKQRQRYGWISVFVVIAVLVAAVSGWFLARRTVPNSNLVTARSFIGPIPEPSRLPFGTRSLAVSHDGTRLAYVSAGQLFVRPMSRTDAASLTAGPPNGSIDPGLINPFFSP